MLSSYKEERSGRKLRTGRLTHWVARHRRPIATHMLRGACYGFGTGAAGFGFWWIEWWLQHNL